MVCRPVRRCRGLLIVGFVLAAIPAPVMEPLEQTFAEGRTRAGPGQSETLVLQPDGVNGTDTFVKDVPLGWNFGTNQSLLVGRNASTGSVARSLLRFDITTVPPGATVVNASLELFADAASPGMIDAYRVSRSWSEGSGARAWHRVRVTVREEAGVRRTLEPVLARLPFAPFDIGDPARDLRVWRGSLETPSQVYEYVMAGGSVVQAAVHFGVTASALSTEEFVITYSTNETSVPPYRTPGFGSSPLWTSPPVGLGASSPTIVDIDGDGSLEIIYGTEDGWVYALNRGGTPEWSVSPFPDSINLPPRVRDVDGDGRLDVIVMMDIGLLVRLNDTGGIEMTFDTGFTPWSPPSLLDVDGDGNLDALVATDAGVQATDVMAGSFLRAYSSGTRTGAPTVADVDGDGGPEIVFGAEDGYVHAYEPGGVERYVGAPLGTGPIRIGVAIGDLDGDGLPEIVTGDDVSPGLEFAWNPRSGASLWSTSLPSRRGGHQTLADVDGDGGLDVLVGLNNGEVVALNGSTGTQMWSAPMGSTWAQAPAVADLDRDGRTEFVAAALSGTSVHVLNSTGSSIHTWTIVPNDPGGLSTPPQFVTPAIADLDGGGKFEVVVPTGAGVQVFGTAGLSRDWRASGYNWNHTNRFGDGASPDGALPLNVTVGIPELFSAQGASWLLADGLQPWFSAGGDYATLQDSIPPGAGWSSWNVTSAVTSWHVGTFPNTGLYLYDPEEATGNLHAFHSSDSPSASLRPRLRITYTFPSFDPRPQIVGAIPNQVRLEDSPPWTTGLSGFAVDADTPLASLRWNVSGYDPATVQITGLNTPGNHDLTFYTQRDAWGSMPVTYWLSDPDGNTARREAWINITPVNDPPWFDPPPTLVVKHDEAYSFNFTPYVDDVDDIITALTLATDDPSHTNVSGLVVSFLYPSSYLGQWAFVGLIVSDGRDSTGEVIAVKVTEDDPPVLTRALPDLTMREGETIVGAFDLDEYFADSNNDTLFFSYGYSHLIITIRADHSVDFVAESDWFGAERVTFRGTDPQGALAEDTIIVTVRPVDDPPLLGSVPDLRVHYDADYSFDLEPYITDADTALEAIAVTTSSPHVTVSGRILTLRYPFALNGTAPDLVISASDGTSTVSRTIRVTIGDDWPPELAVKLADRSFLEDGGIVGAYDLEAAFSDPDGDALFFSSGNVNVQVAIDPMGHVNLASVSDWFGAERVTFRATDVQGALGEDTVTIVVLPVNDAPRIRPLPTIYLNASAGVFDITDFLADVDTNVSALAVTAEGVNVTVVGRSLLFQYRSSTTDRVEVVVSDGYLEARATATVVVALPGVTERLPPALWWLLGIAGPAALIAIAVWRYRRVEWVFLVNDGGLLLASVSREEIKGLDKDLMAGMLTAIMDFTKVSFSGEKARELDEFSLGDRRVEIVQGKEGYLAAVYAGRTPGRLEHIMESLLEHIEERFPHAFGGIVDSDQFKEIPILLRRFMDRAWWPLLSFPLVEPPNANKP